MVIIEFLLFVLIATLRGMFLSGANDLITVLLALECFSLYFYLFIYYLDIPISMYDPMVRSQVY